MGTNYYCSPRPPCSCCGRGYEELHIGKQSRGWKFSLHARHPGDSWAEWKDDLPRMHAIRDEYGTTYTAEEMIAIVEGWQDGLNHAEKYPSPHDYTDPKGYVFCLVDFR